MRHARAIAPLFVVLLGAALAAGAAATAEQQEPAAALANPVAAQSLDQLSSTLDRPLFSPSRRPPAPPPPPVAQAPPPPAPPPPPPNLVLFGVVMDGEGARAVVRSGADKKLLRAQIGDEIDGWKVSQIEGRKVVLSLGDRFATFMLFNDDRGKSDAAPASGISGEPKNSKRQIEAQQVPAQANAPQSGQPKKRRRSRE
jgi:general secretion pathway protein N